MKASSRNLSLQRSLLQIFQTAKGLELGLTFLPNVLFNALNVSPPQAFYFATQFEISANFLIIQYTKTVDDRSRPTDHLNDRLCFKIQIFLMANGKNNGIGKRQYL